MLKQRFGPEFTLSVAVAPNLCCGSDGQRDGAWMKSTIATMRLSRSENPGKVSRAGYANQGQFDCLYM